MSSSKPALSFLASIALLFSMLACGTAPSSSPAPSGGADMALDLAEVADLAISADMDDSPSAAAWQWVNVEGAVCGNGQPTGMGISAKQDAKDLVIFVQGGGACWDVNTCFVLKSAANLESGYTEAHFKNEPTLKTWAFDRQQSLSPFKDANIAFIPYCTGDLHIGDNIKRYEALGQIRDIHHKGAANMQRYLEALASTFPDAERVYLVGVSAGGYGVQLNYHAAAQRFPNAQLHSLSDCGPLVQPWGGRWAEMRAPWKVQAPEACEGCAQDLTAWLDFNLEQYPQGRFSLLAFDADQVISVYFNYPLDGTFTNAINRLKRDHYDAHSNARYFIMPGTEHVMLDRLQHLKANPDTSLLSWVSAWMEDDPSWRDVSP